MARGRKTALILRLTPAERRTLLSWQRTTTLSAGLARRGRIILLRADGMTITAIAATVGLSRRHTYRWIWRFVQVGLAGLEDKPGRGTTAGRDRLPCERHTRGRWANASIHNVL